jgi:hypothetical protein
MKGTDPLSTFKIKMIAWLLIAVVVSQDISINFDGTFTNRNDKLCDGVQYQARKIANLACYVQSIK